MTRVTCCECGKAFEVPGCGWLAGIVRWVCKACMAAGDATIAALDAGKVE